MAEKFDLASVLDHYGIGYRKASGWRKNCCPSMHHEDKDPSASINLDAGHWVCHGCGARGDAIDIIMERENIGFSDAVKKAEAITHQTGIHMGKGKGSHDSFLSF